MPKYLFQASYTTEGARGVVEQGGTARMRAVEQLFASSGGTLEGFYFAFGETDVFAFGELPSNEVASAVALTINASSRVNVRTVPLLSPEEVDAAARTAVDYHPPGR